MKEMRELLFARVLRMTGPALQKAEERSGVVLSETGSDHLHVIAEEVSRVAELCITQNMGTMGTAKYVPGTRDVYKKKQMTLWLTNLTLRSGVNQSTEMDLHPLSSIRILVVDDFKD